MPTTLPANTPIRILVVDDHTLFRRGLTALLARDAGLLVVGDAADAGQALRKAQELQPDVILLDNHLPGVNGVDALPSLLEAAPGACILMLTVSEDEHDLAAALRGGASGYLLKTMEGDDLTAAVHRAAQGDSIIAPEMMGKLIAAYKGTNVKPEPATPAAAPSAIAKTSTPTEQAMASLSPRELDILRGIARGASNKEIARDHGIVETTVKIHVQHVLRKLGVSSRVHAAVMATEQGLL
ncbi:response regulator [Rhodoferax sp.]|jgi:two-component system nitrate/nitrite response regulator NarL|uniref:response regulator n=2 Tax=Rhodoferax sp. TaxID=50421 RepID=UPI0027176119|nr:response regulator [Rhodoferax sp.]MDO9143389.1 response regulator [Rhodoferax sp.]MDP1529178.1 response regulator [Rhodoferax sp.]MDP1943995.1 response regulator [Rhodoferax sp.]MDP2441646.1 response regulator [Rhodoferax sp.]MDP3190554.1 response regulator [Rhodoferax sp.]